MQNEDYKWNVLPLMLEMFLYKVFDNFDLLYFKRSIVY